MSPRKTVPFRAVALLVIEIQDFTIRARILNCVGGMARNSGFQENRDASLGGYFKDNAPLQRLAFQSGAEARPSAASDCWALS